MPNYILCYIAENRIADTCHSFSCSTDQDTTAMTVGLCEQLRVLQGSRHTGSVSRHKEFFQQVA